MENGGTIAALRGERRRAQSENKNSSEERARKAGFASARAVVMLSLAAVVLVGLLFALVVIKKAYARSVDEFERANACTTTLLDDGSYRVSGFNMGTPFEYVEDGRILHGVSIAGIDLGGMDYSEARDTLIADVERRIEGINIRATVESTSLLLTAADFRVSCDVNALIHSALRVGREEQSDYYSIYLRRQEVERDGVDLGGYELTMDEESMRAKVDGVAAVVDKAPTEPYVTILNRVGGGKPGVGIGGSTSDLYSTKTVNAPNGVAMADIQFHNGANGYVLDREDMLEKIMNAFYSGNYNAELELELEETKPMRTAAELAESIGEISRFSTKFESSSDYRARNVQKAAGLLHCTVMTPDEEYSYNELLGPRYEKDGWLPAPGISGGKEYIDSPGGGICQVSSTLYNALLKLGPQIDIVRRAHHSIPGSYVSMGLDATVSYGGPDLVWKVASDTDMILFCYADMSNRTVYSIIYGVPPEDGCTYKVYSETVEKISPPEPLRVEEPLWPTGYSKMVITARTGYNVDVYRQKYDRDGNAVGDPEKLYQDKYAAVRGELHYGTGSPTLPKPQ